MKLFVGLGNPGKEYEKTRHNIGFMVMDTLMNKLNVLDDQKEKFNGLVVKTKIKNEDVILLKPLTYMNSSGLSVREVCDYYKIDIEDVFVIHDDMDFGVGSFKLRQGGSGAGHNGIKSIIASLGGENFKRFRVGIGRPPRECKVDYVLSKFSKEELKELEQVALTICDALIDSFDYTFQNLMTKYNKTKKKEEPKSESNN